jgi:transcriptional regulator
MYVPAHFHETDLSKLDWLAAHDAFGTLISVAAGAPFASHLPVLYRREGTRVTLTGHWARANPQWSAIEGQRVLFIFHGPHAYISPRWYTHPEGNVPTWDYAAAHLYGQVRLIQDPARLEQVVAGLAAHFEAGADAPWRISEVLPTAQLLRAIVGFELVTDDIQLKFKLNQNHPAANVEGVIAALRAQGKDETTALAALMQRALDKRPGYCAAYRPSAVSPG